MPSKRLQISFFPYMYLKNRTISQFVFSTFMSNPYFNPQLLTIVSLKKDIWPTHMA